MLYRRPRLLFLVCAVLLPLAACDPGGVSAPTEVEGPDRTGAIVPQDELARWSGSEGADLAGTTDLPTMRSVSGDVVLDFEEITGPDEVLHLDTYTRDGFVVSGSGPFVAVIDPASIWWSGSKALFNNIMGGTTTLAREDGGLFRLASLDLAELPPFGPAPRIITFTGTRADGSQVVETVTTDGSAGFETATFSSFHAVTSVMWAQEADFHQFDNVTLGAPAPTTKEQCLDAWEDFGFKNRGLCIRLVETGKDSR